MVKKAILGVILVLVMCLPVAANTLHLLSPELKKVMTESEALNTKDPAAAYRFLTQYRQQNPQLQGTDLAAVLSALALYQSYLGNTDAVFELVGKAKQINGDSENEITIELLLTEGYAYDTYGRSDDALLLIKKAIELAAKIENKKMLSDGYQTLAAVYSNAHKNLEAIEAYKKAYQIEFELADPKRLAYLKSAMGTSYHYLKDYEAAVQYKQEAIDYFKANDMPFDELGALFSQAYSFRGLKQKQQAKQNYIMMRALAAELNEKEYLYYSSMGLAELALDDKDVVLARQHFDAAAQFDVYKKDIFSTMGYHRNLAEVLYLEQQHDAAKAELTKVLAILKSLPEKENYTWYIDVAKFEAQIDAATDDYKTAYEKVNEALELTKKHHSQVKEEALQRYKVQFDTEQVELSAQLLAKENEVKKLELDKVRIEQHSERIILIAFALIIFLFILFLHRQVKTSRRLFQLAHSDPLTGIANRRHIIEQAQQTLNAHQHDGERFSLMVFDIDHFKRINDSYGHPAGDIVLQEVTRAISKELGVNDKFGRIGGEEFMVVTPMSHHYGEELAERMRKAIEALKIRVDNNIITPTASFGVATLLHPVKDIEVLYHCADEALYSAKEGGRNQVKVVYCKNNQ